MNHQQPKQRRYLWLTCGLLLFVLLSTWEGQHATYAGTTIPTPTPTPQTGRLRIHKETEPANSNVHFAFTATGNTLSRSFSLTGGERKWLGHLAAGDGYQVQEVVPAGWMQESATCNNGSQVDNIRVTAGDLTVCTFVNVQLGKIIIKKATVPASDTTTHFNFVANVANGGTRTETRFALRNQESYTLNNIVPGSGYSIVEDTKSGWKLSAATCSDGSPVSNIDVDAGETVTCTFTNTQLGTLVVRKVTDPTPDLSNTTFSFTADAPLTPGEFTLKSGQSQTFTGLVPQSGYRIRETTATGWNLTGSSCSNGSATANIRVDPGATVTCTFRNTGTAVDLQLVKEDGGVTAEPGDIIVYRLHYSNSGTQNAANVSLTEKVPDHTTFVGPDGWNCAVGASAGTGCRYDINTLGGDAEGQVLFRVKVNETIPSNVTTIGNVAQLYYNGNRLADESSTNTPVKRASGLSLTKDDEGVTAKADGTVLYTLNYHNRDSQLASNVLITETVPLYTTFGGPARLWSCPLGSPAGTLCIQRIEQIAPATGGVTTFLVNVNKMLPANVTGIENLAHIGNAANPYADSSTEPTELQAAPDLSIQLDSDDETIAPGGTIRYRLAYANLGTQGATNVVITKNIPSYTTFQANSSSSGWICGTNSCSYAVGTLASGAGGTLHFALTLQRPLPAGVLAIINNVQIKDDGMNGVDLVSGNNRHELTTTIHDPATIVASKRAVLAIDVNQDGAVSPGDTLEYVVTLQNQRGTAVRNVIFSDNLESSLYLVDGTTTTQGSIGIGNTPGDPQVQVNVGTFIGDSTVVIRFRAGIRTPLPHGVTTISNQGLVESLDLPTVRTDDPDTDERTDPTVTPLNAQAKLSMSLADFLLVDADGNALVTVGDTLVYRLHLRNGGNSGSAPLQIQIPVAENVVLVPNSVETTAGIVREGQSADDGIIRVDIGEIAGGAEVEINFQVRILASAGFTAIQHQASAAVQGASGAANLISDDPDTGDDNDATTSQLNQSIVNVRRLYLPVIRN